MDTALTRTGDVPVVEVARHRQPFGLLLLAVAQTGAERLISRYREVSPEWFRFPLP